MPRPEWFVVIWCYLMFFWGATIWISSSICCCIQLAPQAFFSLKFVVSRRTDRTTKIRRGPTALRPPRDLSLSWHLQWLHLQDEQSKDIKAKKKAENAKARVVGVFLVLYIWIYLLFFGAQLYGFLRAFVAACSLLLKHSFLWNV